MSAQSEWSTLLSASAEYFERRKQTTLLCNVCETCQAILFRELSGVFKVTSIVPI